MTFVRFLKADGTLDKEVKAEPGQRLLDVGVPGGAVTEPGVRANVSVAVRYLDAWLNGVGAAAIFNLMEDAATAEIARAQVWQWRRHGVRLDDGRAVDAELVRGILDDEVAAYRRELGDRPTRVDEARSLFERVALADDFPEFLTLAAYEHID